MFPARLLVIDIMQTRIDYVSATIQYIGISPPNARTNEPKWQIRKETFDAQGRPIQIEFANLDATSFNLVWDLRASYQYTPTI